MLLSRYVVKQVLIAIVLAILGLWLLKSIFDYLSELNSLSDRYQWLDALSYMVYKAPESLQDFIPLGALLGAVIGLGLLANHSELIVMQTVGISRLKIITWVMKPAMGLIALALLLNQFVIPYTNLLARQIKYDTPLLSSAIDGYWDKQKQRIIHIQHANSQGQLQDITIWQWRSTGELANIIYATNGRHLHAQTWQLDQVVQLNLAVTGESNQQKFVNKSVELPIQPQSIYLLTRRPNDMALTELWQHRQWFAQENRRSLEHEVTFWKKLLSPFATLSLILVACSFVFGSLRSHSLGLRMVTAILFGLVFSYLQDLVGFISLSTGISPFFMVLLPILISGGIGMYLLRKST